MGKILSYPSNSTPSKTFSFLGADPANPTVTNIVPLPAIVSVYNVVSYGADPTGAADSTTAIQDALNAAQDAGQTVFMPAGTYAVSTPLTVPANVTLTGAGAVNPVYSGDLATVIKPVSTFTGDYVLYLSESGNASTPGPALRTFAIDGTSVTGTLHGIYGYGPVQQARLTDLWIANLTGWGIYGVQDSSATGAQYPYWWWVRDVMIDSCGAGGVNITNMTDATWDNVYVLSCGTGTTPGPGWLISGFAGNTTFTNCRGEWCGTNGWHLTGEWWTGDGAGGCVMTGCSTDRSENDGVLIDATGNGPLIISNLMLRRDGRNAGSGGGSYSGLNLDSATIPVTIGTVSVYPGLDDDGSGTLSPEYGITVSSAPLVSITAGYVQAATTALNLSGTNTYLNIGPGLITATGTPADPGSYNALQTQTVILSSNFENSSDSTSYENVTGLDCAVSPGTWKVTGTFITFAAATDATMGFQFTFNGTTTAPSFIQWVPHNSSYAAPSISTTLTDSVTGITTNTSTLYSVDVTMLMTVTAAGTLQLQCALGTAADSAYVVAGSCFTVTPVAL